ncbi:hypothetical protein [Vibrio owensii]
MKSSLLSVSQKEPTSNQIPEQSAHLTKCRLKGASTVYNVLGVNWLTQEVLVEISKQEVQWLPMSTVRMLATAQVAHYEDIVARRTWKILCFDGLSPVPVEPTSQTRWLREEAFAKAKELSSHLRVFVVHQDNSECIWTSKSARDYLQKKLSPYLTWGEFINVAKHNRSSLDKARLCTKLNIANVRSDTHYKTYKEIWLHEHFTGTSKASPAEKGRLNISNRAKAFEVLLIQLLELGFIQIEEGRYIFNHKTLQESGFLFKSFKKNKTASFKNV